MAWDSTSYYSEASARRLGVPPWQPAPAADVFVPALDLEATAERADLLERHGMDDEATAERARFMRDAGNVDASLALVVLGQKTVQLNIPVCGFCGFDSCADNARAGAACAISAGDLGIATLAAAAVAGQHHIDNRIMFSIGRAVLNLGLFGDEKVTMAYGIPLSVTGKSPYFDRK
jgi:uncharacterized ferredoxin-like protein